MTTVKDTVYLPVEIKEKALQFKKSLKISLSTLYRTAIAEYLDRKELEKWENGAKIAAENKEYVKHSKELSNTTGGELHEY